MKRSVMGLIYLIQGLKSAGINLDAKCEQIGIVPDALDPQSLIDREVEWKIVDYLCQGCDPEVGMAVGQQYSLSGYGPYLMLLLTANNVKDALQNAIEFQDLTYLFGRLETYVKENQLWLCYEDVEDENNPLRTNAEISGTFKFIKDIYRLIGLEEVHIDVHLKQRMPDDPKILQQYKNTYGEKVQFNMQHNAFVSTANIIDLALSTADHVMHEVYRYKCLDEIKRLNTIEKNMNGIVAKINNYLDLQNGTIPKLTDISIALNLPERTLRHQLSLEQTNFQMLKEEYLKSKTLKLLETNATIEEIAFLLGYSEASAFNHAFKRWFGMSPKQYLKENLGTL